MSLGLQRGTVRLERYDRRWAACFVREQRRIQRVLGSAIFGIAHIGSTAVPGLAAKPIVDILVGVRSLVHEARRLQGTFAALGYEYRANGSTRGVHLVFAKGPEARRTFYVHVVEYGSRRWHDDLRFRDALRSDRSLARSYAMLKRSLVRRHADDRRAYTTGKVTFIARTLRAHRVHGAADTNIQRAVMHLRRGGLLIYPTETSYAIGCDATNARAVREVFRLKGRERGKPLPIIVTSTAMAKRYTQFTPLARRLAVRYWPGPLTLILAQQFSPPHVGRGSERGWEALAPGVVALDGTLALRVSSHPVARELSRRLDRPIVSTSANHSGQPPCYSVRSARCSLDVQHSTISSSVSALDTGPVAHRRPSTIIDARSTLPVVIRPGSIHVVIKT